MSMKLIELKLPMNQMGLKYELSSNRIKNGIESNNTELTLFKGKLKMKFN